MAKLSLAFPCLVFTLINGLPAQTYDPVDQVYRYRGSAVPKFFLVEEFFLTVLTLNSKGTAVFNQALLSPLGIEPDSAAANALLGAAHEVNSIRGPDLGPLVTNPIEFERVQREEFQKRVWRIKAVYSRLLSDLKVQGVDPQLLDQDYIEQIIRPGVSVTVWPAPDWAMELVAGFENEEEQKN